MIDSKFVLEWFVMYLLFLPPCMVLVFRVGDAIRDRLEERADRREDARIKRRLQAFKIAYRAQKALDRRKKRHHG